MLSLGQAQIGHTAGRAECGRHHGDVVQPIAGDVALQVHALARTGLDSNHSPRRADAPGGKQRVVAVVCPDVDERHARVEHLVEEGEFIGLEGATNIEAEAVVVTQRDVDHGTIVPRQGERNAKPVLSRRLP